MTIRLQSKRADEVRRYRHDWAPFLGIDTITNDIEDDTSATGVDLDSVTLEDGDQSVVFTVSGGEDGTTATITHRIETSGGESEGEFFLIRIGQDEPVSLTDAKAQVRMSDDDSEDMFIQSLIGQARAYCERYSGHIFVQRAVTETFKRWGDYLELGKQPVISVDEVSYIDSAGTPQEYEGLVSTGHPVRIYPAIGESFPGIASGGTISVTYTAGYPDDSISEVPLVAARAMLILIGHWFEFREAAATGIVSSEIAFCVTSLLDELRPISAY